MVTDACFIGLDLGTSAIKGVLTDANGAVLAEAGADTQLLYPREGWVEVDPQQQYRSVCEVIRELASAAPGPVAGLAMAAASGNTLLADADGAPLGNTINWMDHRAERDMPAGLAGLEAEAVRRIVGWPCVTIFPLAHLAWLGENQPDLLGGAEHVGMDTDWLLFRLTGRWRMDYSTATTFHLQDQVSRDYHAPFLERLGIPRQKLSPLVPSGSPVGCLTREAQADTGLSPRTVVVAGCFDHPAAARAVGVLAPGQLMLSCGTSWVGFAPFEDRQAILDACLLCDPFLSDQGGAWGGIFSVPCIGRNVDWYVENVIAPDEPDRMRAFDDLAASSRPGAGGLEIDLRAQPRRIGGSRADISRAVMEGAARLLNEKVVALAARGFRYERAVMVGGPVNSPVWPGIVTDVTGIEIAAGTRSAGARGAAMLAGAGAGVHKKERRDQ